MPAPQPATIFNDLTARLNALSTSAVWLPDDDPEVLALAYEADKLIKADACLGWCIRGTLAGLKGDSAGMRYAFQNAARLGQSRSEPQIGLLTSLANLGYFSEAKRLYERIAGPESGFFTGLFQVGFLFGAFDAMTAFKARAEEMNLAGLNAIRAEASVAEAASEVLTSEGLDDTAITRVLDLAGVVLRDHRLMYVGDRPDVHVFTEHHRGVSIVYSVPVNARTAAELTFELADRLAGSGLPVNNALAVSFQAAR